MPVVFKKLTRVASMMLAIGVSARAQGDAEVLPVPDVLVYRDGDRVQGRLIRREDEFLIFKSVRFGELRVSTADARIENAGTTVVVAATPAPAKDAVAPVPPLASSSPDELTNLFRNFFGPWHGRFALSSQVISDTSDRADFMTEARLKRKWTKDEVSGSIRYDYSKTNDIVTTDIIKGNGLWRRTLPKRLFTVYRPAYEWNRAYKDDGVNRDYILLQQEVGLGVRAVDTENWKVRVGVAENFFDAWDTSAGGHTSAQVESLFAEADLKLPWRIIVTERAVYYYAIKTGNDGFENQFEITKKLTDTLSLGLRHEVRYNDPDVRSQDYSLLRFLIGFDF
ncbi:DUF481 domain-containing protein [Rariglobus hedericola]|uniref:DUF481 domain-containing protein n=1 Tax=Rariglobus hedericola TaxID=2597822 RepID=UPI0039E762FB